MAQYRIRLRLGANDADWYYPETFIVDRKGVVVEAGKPGSYQVDWSDVYAVECVDCGGCLLRGEGERTVQEKHECLPPAGA